MCKKVVKTKHCASIVEAITFVISPKGRLIGYAAARKGYFAAA